MVHATTCQLASTAVNSERLQGCFEDHGIERAVEVDNQQRTVLHIICANPHVTGDSIRTFLQWAPEAADQ